MTNDLILHVKALKEVDERHPVPALWAKAFSDAGGDPSQAKAQYMKLRVVDLSMQKKERATNPRGPVTQAVAPKPLTRGAPHRRDATQWRPGSPRLWAAATGLVVLVGAMQLLPVSTINPFATPRTPSASGSIDPDVRERQSPRPPGARPASTAPVPVDAAAQTSLGDQYYGGRGMPRDQAAAAAWYLKAAEQGYTKAQVNLAVMYKFGEGVARDYAKSAAWFRKAADQGDPAAQVNLGTLYEFGQGVAQDDAESATWYRKAADQGDARALAYLAPMYETGRGVPQDYVEAYKLWNLAVARTPAWETELAADAAMNRDNVAAKMAPAQVAEAQRLSREWRPR